MDGPIFRFLGWEDKTMELNNLNLKRFSLLLLIPVLIQAKDLGTNTTKTNQVFIANETKKSSDVVINTGIVLNQKPQSLSQLVGRGNRRIEVQRPLVEDGTDETREYEDEVSDTSPATDVLSEVTGRERNKEEIFDAVRPYKSHDDDKLDIQDRRRPDAHILGKELNKLKNKGLLAESEDDKQPAYGSDESIAEGASRKTLEIYIAEEKADQQKRHDDNRNIQAPQNNSIGVVKNEDKPKNTSGTGTGILRNKTTTSNSNAVFQEALAAHNKLRAMHHVLPLQWNVTLAEQAQQTAESVASDPSTYQGEPAGENIAQIWHDLPRAPLKATTIWYSEKKSFSFSYPELNDKVKHFTQMVWKDTTQLGMGAAPSPSGKYVIVVALYRPMGNDIHRIRDNVQRAGPAQDVYATIKETISKPTGEKIDKYNIT
ncbi:hypothetical protein OS493_022813 [Desmophyllum pertusum]|uniref:SCP domain-containing protein n=1 Tax=Desmophyllum pertusum TaxID=174260 RepID=A0A9X0D7Y9_9CNID|nr:hypothetical protein OS493_022813 [Desmophyllum pertusum]